MSEKSGYRGYITSRPVRGVSYPHRVQNLVVRDYATRHNLDYKLSATEYAMPGCYMMLYDVLAELPQLEGLILFSLFMLPHKTKSRLEIYDRILGAGCELHAGLEEMVLQDRSDIDDFETMMQVVLTLPNTPMGGYYQKSENPKLNNFFQQAMSVE
ncbi:MAG: sporadic carbohydrate cluster protein, TIGR04323 family [Oscillatoriales cyanobacterium]|uniref:LIC12192 family sporadic carbohydrate cluster protein n=1 Tax=Microcoleus anatoxicus TaxID=2705319 RepID=UPI0029708DA4|nr:MAG: sporadic carbohydrate cluster protein, TIGR04323 family [Oscillatoriales cyanobacterium]TAF62877.1 MAG: sporadic carbohydrate cluster protein, TIGR04323 family [Oscillatoriales cyanobacterium]